MALYIYLKTDSLDLMSSDRQRTSQAYTSTLTSRHAKRCSCPEMVRHALNGPERPKEHVRDADEVDDPLEYWQDHEGIEQEDEEEDAADAANGVTEMRLTRTRQMENRRR